MKKLLFFYLIIMTLASACKKEEEKIIPQPIPKSPTVLDYTKTDHDGNYWIYDVFRDSMGSLYYLQQDSVYIDNTDVINGVIWAGIYNYFGYGSYYSLHDSLNFIVSESGNIIFALLNNNDTMGSWSSTSFNSVTVNVDSILSITVPAGTYTDIKAIKTTLNAFTPFDSTYNPLISTCVYARGIGKIIDEWWMLSPMIKYQRRLVRFSVH